MGEIDYRPLLSLATLRLQYRARGEGGVLRLRASAASVLWQAMRALLRRPTWSAHGLASDGSSVEVTDWPIKPIEILIRAESMDARLLLTAAIIAAHLRSND